MNKPVAALFIAVAFAAGVALADEPEKTAPPSSSAAKVPDLMWGLGVLREGDCPSSDPEPGPAGEAGIRGGAALTRADVRALDDASICVRDEDCAVVEEPCNCSFGVNRAQEGRVRALLKKVRCEQAACCAHLAQAACRFERCVPRSGGLCGRHKMKFDDIDVRAALAHVAQTGKYQMVYHPEVGGLVDVNVTGGVYELLMATLEAGKLVVKRKGRTLWIAPLRHRAWAEAQAAAAPGGRGPQGSGGCGG